MKKLQRLAAIVSAALLPVLVVIVLINVIARAIPGQALSWPFEVSIFIFGISALLVGGQVLEDRGHVAVDILPRLLGRRGREVLKVIALLTIAAVAIVLVIQGSATAIESTRVRERSIFQTTFNPEIWWFRWTIPLSAVLVLFESIRQLVHVRRTVAEDIAADSEDSQLPLAEGDRGSTEGRESR